MQQSTDTSQLTTDAPQAAPLAVSPFGPMRKREQPPVKIPGPRPAPPTSQFHPDATEVAEQVASRWDHAEAFANGDAWDQHHAANVFGGAA